METKGIKITVEQRDLDDDHDIECVGFFGIVDDKNDGYGVIEGGLLGGQLLASAISEGARQLVALHGDKGGLIALDVVINAIGNSVAVDSIASKLSAAHEAAMAIVGEEAEGR